MTELTRRFNERIPIRDGITLAADLVLPAQRPAPAVLHRTPYGRGQVWTLADSFAKAGYATVWVDVRGRGDSDGEFWPYRNDGPDGADVIEWIAAQEWCDGRVATYGASYPGHIQWLTALQQPPALAAMIVMVTPSDPFVEDPTGVPGPMHIYWNRMTDGRAAQNPDTGVDWMEVYRHRPLIELDEAAGFRSERWREQCRHQTLDDWWEPLRYQHRIGEVDVPVLHISGWYDDEEIGTPLNFAAMVNAGHAGQRLLMGPWGHHVNAGRQLGELDFGQDSVIDFEAVTIGFLDQAVRGRQPADPPAPARLFLMGVNHWMDADAWPVPGTVEHVLYLGGERANSRFGDGRLLEAPPSESEAADHWMHDPDRPVPFITDASSSQIGGPDDYSGVETRGDVLVYTTEPLTEPLDLIGPVRLIGHVSTSAADTDVTAKLVDVHPNGFAQRLCDGLTRLRYREGHESALPVTPGEVYEIEVSMWDTAQRIAPGHRIRVEVASSAHPKFAVNLGSGGDDTVAGEGVIAENTLYHDAPRPSRLLLTVLPRQ